MQLEIQCGQCGSRYGIPDRHAGKQVQCPSCGARIAIPRVVEPGPELPPKSYPDLFQAEPDQFAAALAEAANAPACGCPRSPERPVLSTPSPPPHRSTGDTGRGSQKWKMPLPVAIFIVIAAFLGTMHGMFPNAVRFPGSGDRIEREIDQMIQFLNRDAPKQVAPDVRLERVERRPGRSYAYIYTLSSEMSESRKPQVQADITRAVLATPEMQPMLNAGVTIWYKYYDRNGQVALEFPVSAASRQ